MAKRSAKREKPPPGPTVRPDDPPHRGPKKIADVMAVLMARHNLTATTARGELERVWNAIAGPTFAPLTRVGSLRRGLLEILVDHPIVAQQLDGFHKHRLLAELQAALRHNRVTGLRFRRG